MGPDWFAACATAAGVLATAGTGVVIAFQTAATRRSVQVSQAVELQAAKARLDDRAPRLAVTMDPVRWPPHYLASSDATAARGAQAGHGEQFRMPRDGRRLLMLEAPGRLRNDGPQTVTVVLVQPLMPWPEDLEAPEESRTSSMVSEHVRLEEARRAGRRLQLQTAASTPVVVPPGASVPVRLRQVVAVEALVSASLTMEPVPLVVAEIPIDDAFDEGVVDTHTVVVTGQPLTPVDDDHADYTLSATGLDGHPPVGIRPVTVGRKYYFSKSAGQEMPSTAATASPRPGGRRLRSLARRRAS